MSSRTDSKRHEWPVRQYGLLLIVIVAALSGTGCGDEHEDIKPGITEMEARKVLGDPSWILTDKSQVRASLTGHQQCAQSAVKVLVYDRPWYRSDVFVGVDDSDRVACALGGQLLKPE